MIQSLGGENTARGAPATQQVASVSSLFDPPPVCLSKDKAGAIGVECESYLAYNSARYLVARWRRIQRPADPVHTPRVRRGRRGVTVTGRDRESSVLSPPAPRHYERVIHSGGVAGQPAGGIHRDHPESAEWTCQLQNEHTRWHPAAGRRRRRGKCIWEQMAVKRHCNTFAFVQCM